MSNCRCAITIRRGRGRGLVYRLTCSGGYTRILTQLEVWAFVCLRS